MSRSSAAYTVLGMIVNPKEYDGVMKAFDHNHPREWTFDPLTGRELWKEVGDLESIVEEHGLEMFEDDDGNAVVGVALAHASGDMEAHAKFFGLVRDFHGRIGKATAKLEGAGLPVAGLGLYTLLRNSC